MYHRFLMYEKKERDNEVLHIILHFVIVFLLGCLLTG
jgi:hypothetical protein